MLIKEVLQESDNSDAMYQDLVDRVTKIMGKPAKNREQHEGTHKHTWWMKDDATGEHVGVSNVNGHIGITVVYKGPWFDKKARHNPWTASASDTKSVEAVIKKLKTAITATTKKSQDQYGYASHQGGKAYHDSKEAKDFLQKIATQLK